MTAKRKANHRYKSRRVGNGGIVDAPRVQFLAALGVEYFSQLPPYIKSQMVLRETSFTLNQRNQDMVKRARYVAIGILYET